MNEQKLTFKKTCFKKPYISRKVAKSEMKRMNHNYKFEAKDVYFCEECTAYHITTMEREKYQRLKKHLEERK